MCSVQTMPTAPATSPGDALTPRERELLGTTIAVLEESGYDRLTVDEVAARARASKTTIYRRWPSKAALIIAAVAARVDELSVDPVPDGLSLREELMRRVRELMVEAVEVRATLAALIGEAARNPELRASFEAHFVAPRRELMNLCLERRRAAGEISADVDLEIVAPIPTAIIYQRLLISHEPVDDALPERIVDQLMLPLLRSPRLITTSGQPGEQGR